MSLADIRQFLRVDTPKAWLDKAISQIPILLIDHAHCEKKAAATALNLMYRYPERLELQQQLSRLAREELRHFEQVLELMPSRNVHFRSLPPSRYAGGLRQQVRKEEPGQLIDLLIIGAFIEARSCERFAALAEVIPDQELADYYRFLLRSESRHFRNYLKLAERYAKVDISERVEQFRIIENEFIISPDKQFQFHSGVPA
ncbi:tRNA-(ms[2]io[6]A)-hydroxylase [Permianibacter aggregans]|uniref:tRNA-(Ms[2]io[6]A)-hydroxylase n=1 Tax=Permianibacter aggregans TaxID=1510150 RepID=A0A4R6UH40_9GAMM|nr:tRNA-(ms[2]io[6]A)-hydroxylase [Permianibacter aggregans]QGX41146.1 tRNA-(ms[2]io[6]A)-hydroxylase [Permianibacter aggregans]TDQ44543.1 tRNA-(ms[2]io[6]A)-hydroxylase [Permianibacter aggregans]